MSPHRWIYRGQKSEDALGKDFDELDLEVGIVVVCGSPHKIETVTLASGRKGSNPIGSTNINVLEMPYVC